MNSCKDFEFFKDKATSSSCIIRKRLPDQLNSKENRKKTSHMYHHLNQPICYGTLLAGSETKLRFIILYNATIQKIHFR